MSVQTLDCRIVVETVFTEKPFDRNIVFVFTVAMVYVIFAQLEGL